MYINKWMHARFMYMLSMPQIYPCAHKTTLVIRFLPGLCKETVLPFIPIPSVSGPTIMPSFADVGQMSKDY